MKTKSSPRSKSRNKEVQNLIGLAELRRDHLLEYLHLIQDQFGYISKGHISDLAGLMRIATGEIYEVASFYHHFNLTEKNESEKKICVRVCESITCSMFGATDLINDLAKQLPEKAVIQHVPCVGRCASAPVAVVGKRPVLNATAAKVCTLVNNNITDPSLPDYIKLEDALSDGCYKTFKSCLAKEFTPRQIIQKITDAGLRGLGGAGFSAGKKWDIVRSFSGPRVVAINIDEGEPGTFKDRHYLEKAPHQFLEGMLIAAWAVDASTCFIYLRDEYAACHEMLSMEIENLRSEFPSQLPDIELRRGAGSYVCGEESAMLESIEGKRGMPRLRPPYIAEKGLFGKPTLEHNFETLYWIPEIIRKGGDEITVLRGRKGLRSFSVSGRVRNPGVHRAPSGITIHELINDYCGGMLPGHKLKAYFPGGASGGILPAGIQNLPLDFDTLQPHGCFIGSAAIIVLSDHDSIPEYALNAMRFFKKESCGKCTPCRVGTDKAVGLMSEEKWDLEKLTDLATVMAEASICGLGQAAPNPLLSTIKYFGDEL